MPMLGDFGLLRKLCRQVDDAANGRLARAIQEEVARELERLAKKTFEERKSPYGKPWAGEYGPLTLGGTKGDMYRSVRVEVNPDGIELSVDGRLLKRSHGHDITLAVVHEWGGVIRSRFRGSRSRTFRNKLAFLEQERRDDEALGLAKGRGAKPMHAFINGRWVSAYKWNMPSNKILPTRRRMPDEWIKAIEAAATRVMLRWGKV